MKRKSPKIVFRVYLANDMQFLLPELIRAGCEVYVMRESSIRHNPGAMWRFLAMEDEGLVTITDADRAPKVIHDVARTEMMHRGRFAHWRMAYTWGEESKSKKCPGHYRTVLACQFGSAKPLPIRLLCESFTWHSINGTIPDYCTLGSERVPVFGREWPTYGYDEWFLNAAVYPRIAFGGVLTFVDWQDRNGFCNQWFALDIEYCTWANPKSEIIYHGDPSVMRLGDKDIQESVLDFE